MVGRSGKDESLKASMNVALAYWLADERLRRTIEAMKADGFSDQDISEAMPRLVEQSEASRLELLEQLERIAVDPTHQKCVVPHCDTHTRMNSSHELLSTKLAVMGLTAGQRELWIF